MSPTSCRFHPAGVEAPPTDVGVGLEAHGDGVPGAGHLHRAAGGGAQLGQPWRGLVWASKHLAEREGGGHGDSGCGLTDPIGVITMDHIGVITMDHIGVITMDHSGVITSHKQCCIYICGVILL